jgi:HK97 family phage portal protein
VPAFGTTLVPVRTSQRIEVNSPDGFMTEPPGDLWWLGLNSSWSGSMPASVTRATAIIVNPLVRMPWIIRARDGAETAPGAPGYPAWLADPMLLNGSTGGPNRGRFHQLDRLDRFDLWARWVRDALWLGTGLLAYELDADGQPLAGAVQVWDPTRLYRTNDPHAEHVWAVADRSGTMEPIAEDGTIVGTSIRLLLLRHSLPGGVFGWHRAQLGLANEITTYATDTFNSGVPSGVLTTDQSITQDMADNTRTEWESTQKRRRVAVLGNGAKYQQVLLSPVDSELVAMARLSNEQVAHMFELPAWYLDASTNSMTYSNSQDVKQDFIDGPEASWSARIEETLGSVLPWGSSLHIDFTQYTKPTTEPEGAPTGGPTDPA